MCGKGSFGGSGKDRMCPRGCLSELFRSLHGLRKNCFGLGRKSSFCPGRRCRNGFRPRAPLSPCLRARFLSAVPFGGAVSSGRRFVYFPEPCRVDLCGGLCGFVFRFGVFSQKEKVGPCANGLPFGSPNRKAVKKRKGCVVFHAPLLRLSVMRSRRAE